MWTEEKATVTGKYLSVKDAVNEPKPLQRPHPPLWIGSQGPKVGLRMVAELAEGWNHNRGMAVFEEKLAILMQHCKDVGRDPKTMRVSVERTCAIFANDGEREAFIKRCWPGVNPERLKAFLDESCTGTPEVIAKELNFYIERGAELIILWFQDLADVGSGTSMAERFMKEVKPLLKKGV
jgi:alkanesulfonate monooxygenase SsuD/methylene tetrahydromethanopterin reductase-like flavin-dependent oxidoreductase (luciferase family)